MQALFYLDTCEAVERSFDMFCRNRPIPEKIRPFFLTLVRGVLVNKPVLDMVIERFSSHWRISRMACVDRNVLRIAVYELLYLEDIPDKVAIDEAIEVGKKFGTEESGAFINGILDGILMALKAGSLKRQDPVASRPVPQRNRV